MEKKHEETLAWYKDVLEQVNRSFVPLIFDTHRYLVLRGGGGSGKSVFAGWFLLLRVTTEPNHRWLVVRKVAKTLRNSCFDQLVSQGYDLYPHSGMKINRSDMVISFRNGSSILFAGLDDVEKLKSIYNITGIWIEEASELEESDFNQLDIRLRTAFPYPLQIILTFNPVSIKHWLKKRFWDNKDERATIHESTYKDNRFLIPEAVRVLESFRETDEYYYMVYCLNQWGVTGKTIFNAGKITERLEEIVPPVREGFFVYDLDGLKPHNIRFTMEKGGPVKIYREPVKGTPYVIGGDTAGDGSDFFVGQVLDNTSGEQVAVLRHQYDEDVYAYQMYCLGMLYNEALLGIEVNFSTYPVKLLEKAGYKKQYVRQREDTFDGSIQHSFGFRTTATTRNLIIGQLVHTMRQGFHCINDRETLEEMLTFVRNEKLRAEAEPGAHDDCVISLAIAIYIGQQQKTEPNHPAEKRREWTADMWEDYRNAGKNERFKLKELWGEPKR